MTQEHVLAEEEQMTAARTKQHEEEKTYRDKDGEKIRRKQRENARIENRTQGVGSKLPVSACGTI